MRPSNGRRPSPLVQHDAEREQVGASIEVFPQGLLGRHVRYRAERRTGCVMAALSIVAASAPRVHRRELREAEVEHLHVSARGDEDVGWLDVAMQDAFGDARTRSASAI